MALRVTAPLRCWSCSKMLAVRATPGTIVDCPRCKSRNIVRGD